MSHRPHGQSYFLNDLQSIPPASKGVTFGVNENYRFKPSYTYAAAEARRLGPVQHFSARMFYYMPATSPWYATEWRKNPGYQGGFLLDGGVHFVSLIRLLLGTDPSSRAHSVRASCSLIEPHLAPADTLSALICTAGGASGTFLLSAGSQMEGLKYDFAYKGGTVSIHGDTVTVKKRGDVEDVTNFEPSRGVREGVEAWSAGLASREADSRHGFDEALGDLEFMEGILESGKAKGSEWIFKLH